MTAEGGEDDAVRRVVLAVPHGGSTVYVRVDYASLVYGATVEVAGWRLSTVTGGPVARLWASFDVRELPGMLVNLDAGTWKPPA
ncbi:hypothetical protein ABZ738_30380 [Micromonospora sp. NPDC047793]|uniref:hypothetical protein n=1 Tax=Micromonospora sp. NPDC047793 TaxID=3154342 RepID=UPI0033FF9920